MHPWALIVADEDATAGEQLFYLRPVHGLRHAAQSCT